MSDDIQARINAESERNAHKYRMVPNPHHQYSEHWVNLARVTKAEHGNRPYQVILTFANPVACHEALEALCTGREVRGGGLRHDTGTHCPVHPNHDTE